MLFLSVLAGCASSGDSSQAIDIHQLNKSKIKLGISESEFVAILGEAVTSSTKKSIQKPMKNSQDNSKIYFVAIQDIPDRNITDDEFIPYVFFNGSLIASGWKSIGGVKSVGDARNKDIGKWRSTKSGVSRDEVELALLQCQLDASSTVSQTQARDKAASKSKQKQVCTNNGWGQQTCAQNSDSSNLYELGAAIGGIGGYAKLRGRALKGCMAKNKFLPNEN